MTQSNTPDFEDAQAGVPVTDPETGITSVDGVEVELENDGDIPDTGEDNELDLQVNDDENLDVDLPPADDETEIVEDPSTHGDQPKVTKPTATPRTKAPEGYVKPVEFAHVLSEHVKKIVPPQVVYSYLKNNGADSKNPFPVHAIAGYAWYIKPEEGLAWWDAKNARVTAAKQTAADKAAKAAAKAAEAPVTETEGTTSEAAVVEAE